MSGARARRRLRFYECALVWVLHAIAKETPNLSITQSFWRLGKTTVCHPLSPRLFSCFSSTSAYGPPPSTRSKILPFGSTVRSHAVRCGMKHWQQCWVCSNRWNRQEHICCQGQALSPGPQKPCSPPRLAPSIQRLVNQLTAPLDQDPGSWEGILPSDYPLAGIHDHLQQNLAQYNKTELWKSYVWVWVGGNSGLLTDSNTTKRPSHRGASTTLILTPKPGPLEGWPPCTASARLGGLLPFLSLSFVFKGYLVVLLATTGLQMSERGGVWGLGEMGGNG